MICHAESPWKYLRYYHFLSPFPSSLLQSTLPSTVYHLQTFCLSLSHIPLILTMRLRVQFSFCSVSHPASCSPAGHINPCDRCLSVSALLVSTLKKRKKHKVLNSARLPVLEKLHQLNEQVLIWFSSSLTSVSDKQLSVSFVTLTSCIYCFVAYGSHPESSEEESCQWSSITCLCGVGGAGCVACVLEVMARGPLSMQFRKYGVISICVSITGRRGPNISGMQCLEGTQTG